jgi:hypothetical protein
MAHRSRPHRRELDAAGVTDDGAGPQALIAREVKTAEVTITSQ